MSGYTPSTGTPIIRGALPAAGAPVLISPHAAPYFQSAPVQSRKASSTSIVLINPRLAAAAAGAGAGTESAAAEPLSVAAAPPSAAAEPLSAAAAAVDPRIGIIMTRYNREDEKLVINEHRYIPISYEDAQKAIKLILKAYDDKKTLNSVYYTLLTNVATVDLSMYKRHIINNKEVWSVPSSASAEAGARGGKRTRKQRRKSKKHRKTRHRR